MNVIPIALLLSLIGCIVAETEIFSIQWDATEIKGATHWEPVFPNDRQFTGESAKEIENIFVEEIGPTKTIMTKKDGSNYSGIHVTFLNLDDDQYRKVLGLLPDVRPNLVTLQWTGNEVPADSLTAAAAIPVINVEPPTPKSAAASVPAAQLPTALDFSGDGTGTAFSDFMDPHPIRAEKSTEEEREGAARELNWNRAFDEVDHVMEKSGCGESLRKLVDPERGEITRDQLLVGLRNEEDCGKKLTDEQILDLVKHHMTNDKEPLWISAEELMSIHNAWISMERRRYEDESAKFMSGRT